MAMNKVYFWMTIYETLYEGELKSSYDDVIFAAAAAAAADDDDDGFFWLIEFKISSTDGRSMWTVIWLFYFYGVSTLSG